ncbi:MAG TPA: hypothetical protein ENL20_10250 [Candidatus Cloacimonetes bacterium]|nr:hypothetical protein [Candidatus Cloacimonadota bacterium]
MKKIFLILLIIISSQILISKTYKQFPSEPITLKPYTSFDYEEIDESSAIIKSRIWENVYWTLNDSGDEARIFPFNHDGKVLRANWYKEEAGVYIPDAVNVDWEDMTTDDQGNIYIGACGNNDNIRRDLAIYIIKDPFPASTSKTRVFQTIDFYYPEQTEFPANPNNFDCEAIFWAKGKLYLLTKHRADSKTCLYRFDEMELFKNNPITKLGSFEIGGMVTSAEASNDGKKLAVLTYNSVWLFESETDDYFNGKISILPIKAKQCEAICFDDDETLLITNEQMEIFELKIYQLLPYN